MTHTAEIINFERPVVKADIENGYDRLAHELTNALAKNCASLSGCEYQVLFSLISKTFRFHKKEDWVANIQLSEITGMSEAHISKTIRTLKAKNVIIKQGKKTGINPVVSEWKVNQSVKKGNNKKLTNQFSEVNQSVREVNQSVEKTKPIRPPQKKETITKEINTKENSFSPEKITLPEFLSKSLWLEFIQHRKDIKKPLTDLATKKLINQLTKDYANGCDVEDAINMSITSRWAGVFPKQRGQNGRMPAPENFTGTDYGEIKGNF
tara:strand:- start:1196 stop:1993 length:798 start_codon:yes stop_codon:yes gene_type:complete